MNLIARHMRKKRRRQLADGWSATDGLGRAQDEVFDAAFEHAEAARDLDEVAGSRGSSPATAAVLGANAAALHSQANAMHRVRSLARHELRSSATGLPRDKVDELDQLLAEAERSLRAAAIDVERARGLAVGIIDGVPAAMLASL